MRQTCITCGRDQNYTQNFGLKSLDEDGRMLLKLILKYGVGHVEWIHVAENTVRWRAL